VPQLEPRKLYRCWVSAYLAMPDLDANANAVAIRHIKLENEGQERDLQLAEARGFGAEEEAENRR
jgi:hypothetical protein